MEPAADEGTRLSLRRFFKVLLAATLSELFVFALLVALHAALSSQPLEAAADFAGVSLAFTAMATLGAGVAFGWVGFPKYRVPIIFLAIVAGSTLGAHLYIINNPSLPACRDTATNVNGCIMDESYYVPAAEVLLKGTQCGPSVANCNSEHPFLAKALIAAGIAAFGDNAPGWRVLNVLLGTFSLPLIFLLALKVSESRKVAYLSTVLLGLDVMFFSQSSAALLDVPMVFFALLAFVLYFYKVSFWKLDRFTVAGIFMGLSALCKETGIFLMATLATYHYFAGEGEKRLRTVSALEVAIVTAGVFFIGLQAYDSLLARSAFPTFLDQIHYILSYGASLIGPGWSYGGPYGNATQITPLSWITFYQPVTYYGVSAPVCTSMLNGVCQGSISLPTIAYYGVTNVLETWTIYIWIPIAAYAVWKRYRQRLDGLDTFGFVDPQAAETTGSTRLAVLSLIWFSWNYLPYVGMWLYGRVTYPFYFIPALPSVAMGAAYFLTRKVVPGYAVAMYLAGAFFFFLVFFPDKTFLPVWLRALLGK